MSALKSKTVMGAIIVVALGVGTWAVAVGLNKASAWAHKPTAVSHATQGCEGKISFACRWHAKRA